MAQKSKAYRAAAEKIEAGKFYSTSEAVAVARETGSKKFDSTVEVAPGAPPAGKKDVLGRRTHQECSRGRWESRRGRWEGTHDRGLLLAIGLGYVKKMANGERKGKG